MARDIRIDHPGALFDPDAFGHLESDQGCCATRNQNDSADAQRHDYPHLNEVSEVRGI